MIEQREVGDIILLKKEYWGSLEQPITGVVTDIKGNANNPIICFMEDGVASDAFKEEIQAIYKIHGTLNNRVNRDD
jgi:hypothetical protein